MMNSLSGHIMAGYFSFSFGIIFQLCLLLVTVNKHFQMQLQLT